MEKNQKIIQIFNQIPGAFLEQSRFGRSDNTSYWLNAKNISQICELLKDQSEMDQLENISAIHMEEGIVLTYFLRSSRTGGGIILRISTELKSQQGNRNEFQSVALIWENAKYFEKEVADFFARSRGVA